MKTTVAPARELLKSRAGALRPLAVADFCLHGQRPSVLRLLAQHGSLQEREEARRALQARRALLCPVQGFRPLCGGNTR